MFAKLPHDGNVRPLGSMATFSSFSTKLAKLDKGKPLILYLDPFIMTCLAPLGFTFKTKYESRYPQAPNISLLVSSCKCPGTLEETNAERLPMLLHWPCKLDFIWYPEAICLCTRITCINSKVTVASSVGRY